MKRRQLFMLNWKRAQGMTEYIIIVAVIAILSLAVIMRYGNQLRQIFGVATDTLVEGDSARDLTTEDAVDERHTSLNEM